jgi:hydroxypyruvate isomerase
VDVIFELTVCADTVFPELPFLERARRIAEAGFLVDFWRWFADDVDLTALAAESSIRIGCFTGYVDGSLVHPDGLDQFLRGVERTLEVAAMMDCKHLVISTGEIRNDGIPVHAVAENPITRWSTAYRGLVRLAELAEEHDVFYNVEHLNTKVDHPGYPVADVDDALALVDAVASPRIRLLLDLYHLQVQEGNVCDTIARCGDRIGYNHVADVPGRHEPVTCEMNYPKIVETLQANGYRGRVALEAFPLEDSPAALSAFRSYFAAEPVAAT